MVTTTAWALAALIGLSMANPTPVAEPAAATISTSPGCPSPISLQNTGFENGQIAPWTELSNTSPGVTQRIIAHGFNNSKYALQVDAPAAQITEYSLSQQTTGKECYGSYYNISYSWNWKNYTGPEGPGDSYCSFGVGTGYTSQVGPTQGDAGYGTRTPGWHHASYIAQDIYSHGMNIPATYVASVTCVGANNTVLPAFTILLDDFHIKGVNGP